MPKIRKAKSQSFRTRRSPSERRSPSSLGQWNLSAEQKSKRNSLGQRSPGSSIYESNKSPTPSSNSRSPLSRQGTVRASHRRKNSMSQSLNLSSRSPLNPQDRSPSGRRSPNYLSHDLCRSPTVRSPTGKRSPLEFSQSFGLSITPEGRSPAKEMVIQSWNERQKSPTSSIHLDRKSPVGLQSLGIGNFYAETKRSPINQLPIPPITISNPSETCGYSPKSVDSGKFSPCKLPTPKDPSPVKDEVSEKSQKNTPEKKEKTSVMREILAFVRKPSKKASSRTSRFAAAFSKSDIESNAPLVRQSTFSSSPNSSSLAGRTAVTKQLSYEPKISTKLKSVGSKMSLRLRRATETKPKDKKSSGDEISDMESSDGGKLDSHGSKSIYQCGTSGSIASGDNTFELEIIHFEKVGQSHKKHEQIVEEESPNQDGINEASSSSRNELEKPRTLYEELKRSIETLFENKEPIYENIEEFKRDHKNEDGNDMKMMIPRTTIQCPTFEIEPPSRRASFDPPRSPFLENFRSLSDTDHDVPSGESFEVFDSHHHRESSFEDRHSSMDTSFDISRYQSTSYEDQTSSFEIVESNFSDSQTPQPTALQVVKEDASRASNVDLSKSSIEIVDAETFQKATPAGRKSSLETHFDLLENYNGSPKSAFASTNKSHECFPIGMKATHQASLHHHYQHHHHQPGPSHSRTKSPILSNQTSSNYSSLDSSSTYEPIPHSYSHTPQAFDSKNPFVDLSKHHYPLPRKYSHDKTFLCIDKRCALIFEPRNESPQRKSIGQSNTNPGTNQLLSTTDTSSGSEFEGPSPRRALSASPKHSFTFRIVMKKVESSPEELGVSGQRHQRERERMRRDSRRRKSRLNDNKGKSF